MNIVVTISRQIGSGGAFIGQEVARRLGIGYFDREIIRRVAERLNEDEAAVADRDERISTFLENFCRTLAICTPDTAYIPPGIRIIYDENLMAAEAEVIRKIAAIESAVIVGRGGYHLLRGRQGLVNVFLHAPASFRIRRVMASYGMSDAAPARTLIETTDRNRRAYIEKLGGGYWADALHFHLCLDTGAVGLDTAVESIVALAERAGRKQ